MRNKEILRYQDEDLYFAVVEREPDDLRFRITNEAGDEVFARPDENGGNTYSFRLIPEDVVYTVTSFKIGGEVTRFEYSGTE